MSGRAGAGLRQRFESPSHLQAVLLVPGATSGVQVSFAIAGMWPALAAQAAGPAATAALPASPAAAPDGACGLPWPWRCWAA